MKAVEYYIREHTKTTYNYNSYVQAPTPWLTPDQAKKVAEIAREETIKEVCKWLEENVTGYCVINDTYDVKGCIEDLKKHLEDKI